MTQTADQGEPGPRSEPFSTPADTAAYFRAILGASTLPMAVTQGDGHRVRYANPAFCELLGASDVEVVGHALPAVLGPSSLADTVALLDRVYTAGGSASVMVFQEGEGRPGLHATYSAWRMPAAQHRPAGVLVQVIDTPDPGRAAEELRDVNRRLLQAGLAAEGRAEAQLALNAVLQQREAQLRLAAEAQAKLLAEEQLAHAGAAAALRVRDEFLGMAAHELRRPLTVILARAQMALHLVGDGTPEAAQVRHQAEAIVAAAGRLEALLTDLLDVSRMRTGALSAQFERMDLAALVAAVARRHQEEAETRRIVCTLPPRPVWLQGDLARLEQVLDNLLSNAVKYSPAGGEVVIQLGRVADGVELTVRDSGIGLPPGEEERIFEPFRRAANAAAHDVPGVGLGLHISRQIAEVHGGTLRAESPGEGAGTTLRLRLPAPRMETDSTPEPAPAGTS
jgi:PAS domain S-box-containing protein